MYVIQNHIGINFEWSESKEYLERRLHCEWFDIDPKTREKGRHRVTFYPSGCKIVNLDTVENTSSKKKNRK